MKKVDFLFGIHCHQPVGNFEHIFQEAYERSYLPFLRMMEAHPKIKFSVHYSGILYDWFLKNRPELFNLIKKLVQRGQAEVMTAGYYEPIIPVIPDNDKTGQIRMQSDFIKEKFGKEPKGMWLTERIWEPSLPSILAKTGIDYVTVDDYHFISAGLPKEKLFGYYITEDEGKTLKVFPINKDLRYLIPFQLPDKTIEYLRSIAREGGAAAILADDGEKFGVWPGTYKWVFQEKYLEKLLTEFEANLDWIEFMTFSEYIDSHPPIGRIYLPTASYYEMMEWALLTESGKKMEKIVETLKNEGKFDEYSQFFKGGFFRNFFVKYPEANNMHKKMLYVSDKINVIKEQIKDKGKIQKATEYLYKGQCNCAYWHGVFGGLYLNYLRHAVYENLIKAENEVDMISGKGKEYADIVITDFDKDGNDEVILSNPNLNICFSPNYGGSIFELDYRPKAFNIIDTLSRKEEVYHGKLRKTALSHNTSSGGVPSIHDISNIKEKGLGGKLIYDWHRRLSLLDHFFSADTDLNKVTSMSYHETGDFTVLPYKYSCQKNSPDISIVLTRDGRVDRIPIRIGKSVSISKKTSLISIRYKIINLSKEEKDLWFSPEFNFSMLAGKAPDRYYKIDDIELDDRTVGSRGETAGVKNMKIIDEWARFVISLSFGEPALLWRFPVETVSQSESGLEANYQSSVVLPSWKFKLAPNEEKDLSMTMDIGDHEKYAGT